jgi:hypothetical protein
MDSERLDGVIPRIEQDARSQGINFDDPANAFTLWADLSHVMQYCGSRGTLNSVQLLAAEHAKSLDLYIVREPFGNFGIMKYERG